MYDFEPQKVKNFLIDNDVEKVCIQLPSGLRPYIEEISRPYLEENVRPLFLSDPSFGSCFLPDREARSMGCDALVHYGHSDMGISASLPTLYIEVRAEVESLESLNKVLSELKGSVWGLTSTVQYVDYLPDLKDFLKEESISSLIGDPGPRTKYPGQVLGCDWGSAKSVEEEVDGFIYFGSGDFHPKGIALSTGKRVITIEPESGYFEFLDFDMNDFMKKRYAMIENAKSAESFGILVSSMRGQRRLDLANILADKLLDKGYNAYILSMREIKPDGIQDYRLGAYINTACPRIPFEDAGSYDKPILTPFEAKVLLGEKNFDPYELDEIGINF